MTRPTLASRRATAKTSGACALSSLTAHQRVARLHWRAVRDIPAAHHASARKVARSGPQASSDMLASDYVLSGQQEVDRWARRTGESHPRDARRLQLTVQEDGP
jgi:hypothetical protein